MTLIANASSCPPVMLFVSDDDTVPYNQSTNMKNALTLAFPSVDITEYTLANSDAHAFQYWHTQNPAVSDCISHQVINFLQSHP